MDVSRERHILLFPNKFFYLFLFSFSVFDFASIFLFTFHRLVFLASSNLLGDVNRRLELMLGCANKVIESAQAKDIEAVDAALAGSSKSTFQTGGSRGPLQLNSPLREEGELDGERAAVSLLGDTSTSGPRRLRRNTRRVVNGQSIPNGVSTPLVSVNRIINSDELVSDTGGNRHESVTDRAQPGQSLMVCLQFLCFLLLVFIACSVVCCAHHPSRHHHWNLLGFSTFFFLHADPCLQINKWNG